MAATDTARRRQVALIAPLLIAALAAGACPKKKLEKFHVRHRADADSYVDVDAVVLLDKLELTFSFSAKQWRPYAELVHHRRVHVLREGALNLRKVFIPYDATSGILDLSARVTRADGSVKELGEVPTVDYNRYPPGHAAALLYNEPAAKVFAVPELQVGDVIEYRYRRVIKDASWVEPLRIGGPYPIERGEVAVVYPEGFDVDYRVVKNGEIVDFKPIRLPDRVRADPEDSSTEGVPGTRLLWVFERVPALFPAPLRPTDEALARQVQVQFKAFHYQGRAFEGFGGWNDVAKWYGRLIGDADAPDGSAKKIVKQIGAARGVAKSERVRRVNRYLADNIVPVDFDGSLASLKVHGSASVLATKVGDSKDLSNLALGMLRAAGVEGFPVLCSRRGTRALVPDLPTPEAFNSVVVATVSGGKYSYFAPDGYGLPAGRLPWRVQGSQALLIRPSGAELVELPEDKVADNRREVEIKLSLALDGRAEGTALLTLTGQEAREARLALQRNDKEGQLRFVGGLFLGEDSALAVTDVQPPKTTDSEKPLKLLATLRAAPLATPAQRMLRLTTTALLGKSLAFLWREGRRTPLDLGYRMHERISVAVAMPASWGIWELPQDRKRDSALVSIDDRYSVADGQVWFLRERTQKVGRVEPAVYSDLKSFYEALWQAQDLPIQLVQGGDRGKDYGGEPF